MAHGFRRERPPRRRGAGARQPLPPSFVARLDDEERVVLVSLMMQVLSIIAPPQPEPEGDEFDRMLAEAGLSHLDADLADPGAGGAAAGSVATSDLDDPDRDPALDRLIPDAHRDDPLVSAEFRRMAAPGLRARKAANLEAAIGALTREGQDGGEPELRLDEEEAQAFVVALTDVRLVVGDRLQLRTDVDADRLESALANGALDEQAAWLITVYDFLTWLQETLTQAMLDHLDDAHG